MNRILGLFLFFGYVSCTNFSYAIGEDSRTNRVEMARADKISVSVAPIERFEKIDRIAVFVEKISKADFLDKSDVEIKRVMIAALAGRTDIEIGRIMSAALAGRTDVEIERIMSAALAGRNDIEIGRIVRAALAGRTDIEIGRIMYAVLAAYDKPDKSAFLIKMVEMCDWLDIEVADVTPANNVDRFNVDFFDCVGGRGVFVYLC